MCFAIWLLAAFRFFGHCNGQASRCHIRRPLPLRRVKGEDVSSSDCRADDAAVATVLPQVGRSLAPAAPGVGRSALSSKNVQRQFPKLMNPTDRSVLMNYTFLASEHASSMRCFDGLASKIAVDATLWRWYATNLGSFPEGRSCSISGPWSDIVRNARSTNLPFGRVRIFASAREIVSMCPSSPQTIARLGLGAGSGAGAFARNMEGGRCLISPISTSNWRS
jgi:hypothetical protein